MHREIISLITRLIEQVGDIQSEAALALDAVIVKSTFKQAKGYDIYLSEPLKHLVLDEEDQKVLTFILASQIIKATRPQQRLSLLWLLGKMHPRVALPLWIEAIRTIYPTLDDNERHAAIIGLDNFLFYAQSTNSLESVSSFIQVSASDFLLDFLQTVQQTHSTSTQDAGERVLSRLSL